MSVVGPRPHATAHNEHYHQELIRGYMLRHKVKPGITGLAQVKKGFAAKRKRWRRCKSESRFDHKYIQQWSLWLDIKIILGTFMVILSKKTLTESKLLLWQVFLRLANLGNPRR